MGEKTQTRPCAAIFGRSGDGVGKRHQQRPRQALFCAPLVSFPYPVPKTAHRAAQGRVRFFSPEGAPPPKGGGAGYHLSWVGRVGSVRSKLAHTPPTGRVCCFDGVVLLPSHLTGHKSPHRGEFGFCLLAGASQEDHPPFRQSRIRTQAEEKNTSAPLF